MEKRRFDIQQVRRDFPMMRKNMSGKPLIYFDSAATTQKPHCVIDALNRFYSEEYATVHRAVYEIAAKATEGYAAVRTKVQQFIGAKEEEEIVFTRGTTDALNLVAYSLGERFIDEGDEIIISVMEHHSNIVPWQLLAGRKGARLRWIPIDQNGELDLEAFKRLLSPRTKIVSIAHISNATGTINPVEEIITLAHSVGAKVVIDGAQAAAHLSLNVAELGCDFYAFSGHKIYGPTGIGVLYGKRALLEEMPPYQGGGDMIDQVTTEGTTFQSAPLKFEAGTPMIAEVIGLGAAIDYLTSLGLDEIALWEQKLLKRATQRLEGIANIKLVGTAPEKGPIITFTVDGLHALDLGTLLSLKGVAIRTGHLCAQPTLKHFGVSSLARISFGLYNTFEEIDASIQALKESMLLLQPQLSF